MSNQKCANCGRVITCGCQKRLASNGKHCCKGCVATYENTIKITASKKETDRLY